MFVDPLDPRRLMSVATSGAPVSSSDLRDVIVRNVTPPIIVTPPVVTDTTPAPLIKVSRTGTLFVTGSARPESITVRYRPSGRVAVDITRKAADGRLFNYGTNFKRSDIKRLNIDAGAGRDDVNVYVGDLTGASTIHGGTGDDRLYTRGVSTALHGDGGNDLLISDQEPVLTLIQVSGDSAVPINENRELLIDASYNVLYGGAGGDVLRTFGGEDTLFGGSGEDIYEPMAANIDRVELSAGNGLPKLQRWSDMSVAASRVGTFEVELKRPTVGAPVYTRYWTLRESTFTSIVDAGQ